ncbi:hypothetical protein E4T02_14550 [Listeria monocytogenes]|uniref:Uncharacterized protein n=1 Tax=Listeria seeligeri TaxID=1640 RepID=A0A7X0X415_LISSE|nr:MULTISPECIES: hypothetical protein [Listeria]EAE3734172.1 hypothetical protein [Listeria monocytogenes]EAE3749719.1 hypothetical protein [Listeria monocytogenes]EAE5773710.1 hypothetical protein [Listeria monocytogenes]EAE6178253.1 hypothetical protein [Listeria monocytogenes]EAE6181314.1 hypothetical protein [Listeria monocytogenes]
MKKRNKIVVLALVFVLSFLPFSFLGVHNVSASENQKVTQADLEKNFLYELENYNSVGLTKQEAQNNYDIYMSMSKAKKKEVTNLVNNPSEFDNKVTRNGALVEGNGLQQYASKNKTVYVPMKVFGITWMKWAARGSYKTSGKRVSSASGISAYLYYKNPLFALYSSSIKDKYCYVSGGKYKGRVKANIKGGYGNWGLQVMRIDFTITVNYQGKGSYKINSTKFL